MYLAQCASRVAPSPSCVFIRFTRLGSRPHAHTNEYRAAPMSRPGNPNALM